MDTYRRRKEIIDILMLRRRTTAGALAKEFGVSVRTIQYDIQALSPLYPIYTKQGNEGGIYIRENYLPYANTLSDFELQALSEMVEITQEARHRKVLLQIIRKYGPGSRGE